MPAIAYARFVSEILSLYRPPHRRASTRDKMRKVLEEFGALPGIRTTSDITPSAIIAWLDAHSGRRPITNRSYLGAFRSAVNIARKLRYIRVSPWEIRADWIDWDGDDDDDEPAARHLSIEEAGRLLELADREATSGDWEAGRLQALVATYLHTGLRKAEALGLKAGDVRVAERCLIVRGRRQRRLKTKSSRRLVALHPDLVPVLGAWLPRCGSEWLFPNRDRRGTPWLHGSRGGKALDQVKALGSRAGLPAVTIQSFRRTLATHARRFGLGPLEVRELLGHSSVGTQEWYLEDDLADQRHAIEKIRYRDAG